MSGCIEHLHLEYHVHRAADQAPTEQGFNVNANGKDVNDNQTPTEIIEDVIELNLDDRADDPATGSEAAGEPQSPSGADDRRCGVLRRVGP